jgi:MFS family permease
MIHGIAILLSLTIEHIGTEKKRTNLQIITGQAIVYVISLPGPIIVGLLTEIPCLGRIRSMFLLSLITILSVVCSILILEQFEIFIGIASLSIQAILYILLIYRAEVYPTKLRDQALAFLQLISGLAVIITQFFFIQLHYYHYLVPYYLGAALCALTILLIELLPYETYGHDIDIEFQKLGENDYSSIIKNT